MDDRMTKKTWFSAAVGPNAKTADIAIYNEIGGWGIYAGDFRDALTALGPVETINLRINSLGGDVFQGVAIHNMLARHPATINVTVDGAAMSIASLVAMAGDTITMPENATMFVHNPFGDVTGDADDMAEMSDWLRKLGASMATSYARKTGGTPEEMLAIMDANTWMTAAEAKEKGFADVVAPPAKITARFDLKHFKPPASIMAAYDPDGDGDDDALEAIGYIGAAIDSLADAVGCLTGTGDPDAPPGPQQPMMAKLKASVEKAAKAALAAKATRQVAQGTADAKSRDAGAEEIASLCLLAGMPGKTSEFLRAGKTAKEVYSALQELRADRGRESDIDVSARHNPMVGHEEAAAAWRKALEKINSGVGGPGN